MYKITLSEVQTDSRTADEQRLKLECLPARELAVAPSGPTAARAGPAMGPGEMPEQRGTECSWEWSTHPPTCLVVLNVWRDQAGSDLRPLVPAAPVCQHRNTWSRNPSSTSRLFDSPCVQAVTSPCTSPFKVTSGFALPFSIPVYNEQNFTLSSRRQLVLLCHWSPFSSPLCMKRQFPGLHSLL